MRIFFLENDPEVYGPLVRYLINSGHTVNHAFTLKGAAYLLEFKPGADEFDLFLFDVGLPSEKVKHFKDNKDDVPYADPMGFNGLIFLLNNLDILGGFTDRIAILTAYKQQILDMKSINVIDKTFVHEKLKEEDDWKRVSQEQVTKIRYTDIESGKSYTLSFLDKGGDNIITLIEKFINRG